MGSVRGAPGKKCPVETASASPNHRSRYRRDRLNVFRRRRESRNQGTRRGRAATAGAGGGDAATSRGPATNCPRGKTAPQVRLGASAAFANRAGFKGGVTGWGSARSPPDKRYRTEPALADQADFEVRPPARRHTTARFARRLWRARGTINGLTSPINTLSRFVKDVFVASRQ
jgi:hypothetical protein